MNANLKTGLLPSGRCGGASALSRAALFLISSILRCLSILASFSRCLRSFSQVTRAISTWKIIEFQTKVREDFTMTEMAFSWLKAPTSAFTFKTLY